MVPIMQPFVLPLLFVTLYGSGFVGAKLGLPHAEPFTFLALRFGLAAVLLGLLACLLRVPWPSERRLVVDLAGAGLLTVGLFSAGVFYSIANGVPPAVSALIIALHPILVALGAGIWLDERVGRQQWVGMFLGLLGVYLVLNQRLLLDPAYLQGALFSVLGLIGLSSGSIYQKARCTGMNVFSGGAIQCVVCAIAMTLGAVCFETGVVDWGMEFAVALLWMAVIVSVGAVSMLYVMIRRGEASRVASVFYLVPVSAAVTAYLWFGQTVDAAALAGSGLAALGVVLASLSPGKLGGKTKTGEAS
jgi:drug/metabolite transporter (DMT)-like permease